MDDVKDLYNNNDPVTVLNDGSFIGKNCRIRKDEFLGHGFLKAYAPWCGHCQGKVKCINQLAEILPEFGVAVYVINADDNPMFAEHFREKVRGFPTFLHVNESGHIGDVMKTKDGAQVYSVPDIIASLCGNDARVCQYAEIMKDCS